MAEDWQRKAYEAWRKQAQDDVVTNGANSKIEQALMAEPAWRRLKTIYGEAPQLELTGDRLKKESADDIIYCLSSPPSATTRTSSSTLTVVIGIVILMGLISLVCGFMLLYMYSNDKDQSGSSGQPIQVESGPPSEPIKSGQKPVQPKAPPKPKGTG